MAVVSGHTAMFQVKVIFYFFILFGTFEYGCSSSSCNIDIVEIVPQDLTYEATTFFPTPIWKVWEDLIQSATKYIRINSLYWSMLSNDTNTLDNSSFHGERIFWMLVKKSKTVPIYINHDIHNASCNDMKILSNYKNIKVDFINVQRFENNGIQHSKMIIGDDKKAFIGSANMDWRSLSQIKEIGAYFTNCDELIYDLNAFWNAINLLTGNSSIIPKIWPQNTWPKYNLTNPLVTTIKGVTMSLYTATSPISFNPPHRTDDLSALINTIKEAKKFILISVMEFAPLLTNFTSSSSKYWPIIEDAIITAAIEKGVKVKMLISFWKHSREADLIFLRSMAELNNKVKYMREIDLQIKLFIVPAFNDFQRTLPFSRVSHSKYMVTDSTIYVGTSNWSGNYFKGTVGVSLIAKENCCSKINGQRSIRQTLENVFMADWNSIYAHVLS